MNIRLFRYYFPFPLVFPFPKDLPSKPGLALPFDLPAPFRLTFLRSFRMAMLSALFFCFAAMDMLTCSFRSSQDFLLFPFSFSFFFMAFFSLPSSSRTFTPSSRASAFSHFSLSSIVFLLSSGNAASFSLRAASCSSA